MLSKLLVSPAVLLTLLAGCSGGNFDVVESPDTSSDETSVDSSSTPEDSNGPDSSSPEDTGAFVDSSTSPDAEIESGSVDSGSVDSASVDSAPTDSAIDSMVVDTGTDSATDTRPLDTCVVNACGGCTVLSGTLGASCAGGCGGGKLTCKGSDALECTGMAAPNACGGCGTLDHVLGTACGKCNAGTYVCDTADTSKNTTKCAEKVTTPAPGTACTGSEAGKCGTATYQCALQSDGTTWTTKCVDPVTTPAVGTPCTGTEAGKCGSARYQCVTVGTTTTTKCVDPVPVSSLDPSKKCGFCGSSLTKCNSSNTDVICEIPDDRINKISPNSTATAVTRGIDDLNRFTALAIPLTTSANETRIDSVTVLLSRYVYACMYSEDGSGGCYAPDPNCVCDCWSPCLNKSTGPDALKLELVTGTPSLPGSVLDTATIAPTAVPVGVATYPYPPPTSPTTFTFTNKSIRLPTGTKVFLRFVATGGGTRYQLWGTVPTTSTTTPVLYSENAATWKDNGVDPYLVVSQYACF